METGDETCVKIKSEWPYLYRASDSNDETVAFMFSRNRDPKPAKRFIRKALARAWQVREDQY